MRRRDRRAGNAPVSFFSFQDVITSVTGIILLVTLLLTLELVTRAEVTAAAVQTTTAESSDPATLNRKAAEARQQRETLRQQTAALGAVLQDAAGASPLASDEDVKAAAADVLTAQQQNERLRRNLAAAQAALQTVREALDGGQAAQRAAVEQSAETRRQTEGLRQSKKLVLLPGPGDAKRPLIVDCAADRLTVGSPNDVGELLPIRSWRGEAAGDLVAWSTTRDEDQEYFLIMVRPDAVSTSDRVITRLRAAGFDVGWEPAPADVQLFESK